MLERAILPAEQLHLPPQHPVTDLSSEAAWIPCPTGALNDKRRGALWLREPPTIKRTRNTIRLALLLLG